MQTARLCGAAPILDVTGTLGCAVAVLLDLKCDTVLLSLLSRSEGDGEVASLEPAMVAQVMRLMTMLMRLEFSIDRVLHGNPEVVILVLDILRRSTVAGAESGRDEWLLSMSCLQLLSSLIVSARGRACLKANASRCLYVLELSVSRAPTQQHKVVASSLLTRMQLACPHNAPTPPPSTSRRGDKTDTVSLRALLSGAVTQKPAERLECLRGLVQVVSTAQGRQRLLSLGVVAAAGGDASRVQCDAIDVLFAVFASAGSAIIEANPSAASGHVIPQIRSLCAHIVYVLAEPAVSCEEVSAASQLHEAGAVRVLLSSIQDDRGGKALTLGVEPKGPALLTCLAALLRLLSDARVRSSMLAERSQSALADFLDLVALVRSPNMHVSLYATLVVGKLLSDRCSPSACRIFLSRSGIMAILVDMLLETSTSIAASFSSSSHLLRDSQVRRGILLHVIAAGSWVGLRMAWHVSVLA